MADNLTDDQAAQDFEEFLNGQLASKGARRVVIRDPAYAGQQQVSDGIDHSAEVDTSSPEQAVKTALRKYGLTSDDAELLEGVPADKVEAAAARLAANLDPNRPRRPQPTPRPLSQSERGDYSSQRTGFEGLKDALNASAARADGQGAFREIR
jgi:hypothetical protein